MSKVLETVIGIIKDNEDLNPKVSTDEIKLEHDFKVDLGFDSLALMSLVYELQEVYPELDEMVIADWTKVEDCVKHIEGM